MLVPVQVLHEVCTDITQNSADKYKAHLQFTLRLNSEEHIGRFVMTLYINDEPMFEETYAVHSLPVNKGIATEIKQRLAIRLLKSILEAGVSKGIEWYQKKMEYNGRSNWSAAPVGDWHGP